jgi:hypothetical protein
MLTIGGVWAVLSTVIAIVARISTQIEPNSLTGGLQSQF